MAVSYDNRLMSIPIASKPRIALRPSCMTKCFESLTAFARDSSASNAALIDQHAIGSRGAVDLPSDTTTARMALRPDSPSHTTDIPSGAAAPRSFDACSREASDTDTSMASVRIDFAWVAAPSSASTALSSSTSAPPNFARIGFHRDVIVENSNLVKSFWSAAMLGFGIHPPMRTSTGTSLRRRINSALRSTRSRDSSNAALSFGVCSSAWSNTAESAPYRLINFAAVFSPTPGTPSRLSLGSPRKAA